MIIQIIKKYNIAAMALPVLNAYISTTPKSTNKWINKEYPLP